MSSSRSSALAAVAAGVALGGCVDEAALSQRCNDAHLCPTGRVCIDGRCVPRAGVDAGAGEGEGEGEGAAEGEGEGEGEGQSASTCVDVLLANPGAPSGVYALDIGGGAVDVECDMVTAGGGWALVVRHTEGDPCPGAWLPEPRGCGRGSVTSATASFVAPYAFSEVRGSVRALAFGGGDGFRDAVDLASTYVDGVAITVGQPRRHVYAFAVGVSDSAGACCATSHCPCDGGAAPPAFVGDAYLCEEPRLSIEPGNPAGAERFYDNDDVLFDGADVDDAACVGAPETAPDFQATLASPGSALDVHIMMSQATTDENVAVIAVELWTR